MWLDKLLVVTSLVVLADAQKCSDGFTYFEATNSCLIEFRKLQVFYDAAADCMALMGSLWRMPASVTAAQLKSITNESNADHWIGVARDTDQDFIWIEDGSALSDDNWLSGVPSEGNDCAYTNEEKGESKWHGANCEDKKFSFCEVSLRPKNCPFEYTYYEPEKTCIWTSKRKRHFHEAQEFCETIGANLLKVETPAKANFLKYVRNNGVTLYWIGGIRNESSDFMWIDDNRPLTYTPWYRTKPRDSDDCLAMKPTAPRFYGSRCETSNFFFFCEKLVSQDPAGSCPAGFTAFQNNDSCIVEVKHQQSFHNAQKDCVAMGGSLWNMPKDVTNAQLSGFTNDAQTRHWIGVTRNGDKDFISIKDLSPLTFTNWDYVEPSEGNDCVYTLERVGASNWYGGNCTEKMPFYCEVSLKPKKCFPGWYYYQPENSCIREISRAKNFEDSRQFCQAQGGKLLTKLTTDKVAFCQYISFDQVCWIGGKKYPDGSSRWVDDNTTMPTIPLMFQAREGEDCFVLYPTLQKFLPIACERPAPYILCEKPYVPRTPPVPVTVCPKRWTMSYDKLRCIKRIHNKKRTWQKAREHCKVRGGDLVTIPVPEDLPIVEKLLGKYSYWIGLHDHGDGKFVWLDDTEETKVKNFNSPPRNHLGSERCVVAIGKRGGKWRDKRCGVRRYSVCQKDAETT